MGFARSRSAWTPPRLAILLLIICWSLYMLPKFTAQRPPHTKEEFVAQMLETEIDGEYNLEPLAALCRSKKQTPGLIVKCKATPGGMGNVRNMMLNCYRFAIEGGG